MGEYTDKIKGKINQTTGKMTDDDTKVAKGNLQEKKGELKGAFERGKARVKDALEDKDV